MRIKRGIREKVNNLIKNVNGQTLTIDSHRTTDNTYMQIKIVQTLNHNCQIPNRENWNIIIHNNVITIEYPLRSQKPRIALNCCR